MPFIEKILCLKEIKETKFNLRMGFRYSKRLYLGKTLQPFQGLCKGEVGESEEWFLISFLMILYLKEKRHGVEIKTVIKEYAFKIVTMMFVNDTNF